MSARFQRVSGVVFLYYLCVLTTRGQVPSLLNYQGRIAVGTTAFNGVGQFKLALVDQGASQVYWVNAVDGNNDGEPDQAVTATVAKGLYSILLGDTNVANMAAIPPGAFANAEVYLRVWFNDGVQCFPTAYPR